MAKITISLVVALYAIQVKLKDFARVVLVLVLFQLTS